MKEMKKIVFLMGICMSSIGIVAVQSQQVFTMPGTSVKYVQEDVPGALNLAGKENKMVLVFFYRARVAACRMTAKYAFNNDSVVQYLENNFINIRYDIDDTVASRTVTDKYHVTDWELVFLNAKGEVKYRIGGGMTVYDARHFFVEASNALRLKNANAGDGVSFLEGPGAVSKAIARSSGANKLAFVDCYTKWCMPCAEMSNKVFPKKEVGDYFNPRFVAAKLDMESPEGRELNKQYQVTAYPTFLILDNKGNVIGRVVGGMQKDTFIREVAKELNKAREKIGLSAELERNWQLLDYQQDHVFGISMEKAYRELLKGKKSNTVLVAVIDSGIDTLHEDLQPVLWHNLLEKENGKDNDGNGYKGDVFGWNFLGSADDPKKNVVADSYEYTRFYFMYRDKFAAISDASQVENKDRELYSDWMKSRIEILKASSGQQQINFLKYLLSCYPAWDAVFREKMNKPFYTLADLEAYKTEDAKLTLEQHQYGSLFKKAKAGITNKQLPETIQGVIDSIRLQMKLPDAPPQDYRGEIVKDDYTNLKDRYYGNNNVMAGNVMHGTHVAGIIGAMRNNGTGIDGIADNVKIMMVRVTPDGDEHDKDVALAIRYAVDNGAKIINMSFGKFFSPNRQWVEDAIRYADQKGVLLVKAAGNSSVNLDSVNCYPTARYLEDHKLAPNVITVGASGPYSQGLAAFFSNYGKEMVDVFAPGVQIYSTVGFNNGGTPVHRYKLLDGTSMASPVVTGLAAVLKSYFPGLTAKQIKYIIETSVTKINEPVNKPGSGQAVSMSRLCRTGGIVNAYQAIKLAEMMH
jgi:subtilisin family serine protease